ncbi:MAG: hypothetical protein AB1439_10740 [candidate division FCPU426 bacterium]
MRRYLNILEEKNDPRHIEEYLGAFSESLKLILQQNPVERMGHAVLLAAKTAMRLKAAEPRLREHEIANRLQFIARNIRLTTILKDLTPEEKRILKLHPSNHNAPVSKPRRKPAASSGVIPRGVRKRSQRSKPRGR